MGALAVGRVNDLGQYWPDDDTHRSVTGAYGRTDYLANELDAVDRRVTSRIDDREDRTRQILLFMIVPLLIAMSTIAAGLFAALHH